MVAVFHNGVNANVILTNESSPSDDLYPFLITLLHHSAVCLLSFPCMFLSLMSELPYFIPGKRCRYILVQNFPKTCPNSCSMLFFITQYWRLSAVWYDGIDEKYNCSDPKIFLCWVQSPFVNSLFLLPPSILLPSICWLLIRGQFFIASASLDPPP